MRPGHLFSVLRSLSKDLKSQIGAGMLPKYKLSIWNPQAKWLEGNSQNRDFTHYDVWGVVRFKCTRRRGDILTISFS